MSDIQEKMSDILIAFRVIKGDCERLAAENERLSEKVVFKTEANRRLAKINANLRVENEKLKAEMVAPTDSGIVRFDSMCEEFNTGNRNLVSLCCGLWNSGKASGNSEKS